MHRLNRPDRDQRIVLARIKGGATWPTIAKHVGLTQRQCQRVWTRWQDSQPHIDPEQARAVLDSYDTAITHADVLELEADDVAAQLEVIHAKGRAMDERAEFMSGLGILPQDASRPSARRRISRLLKEVSLACKRNGVGYQAERDILSTVGRGLSTE